MQAAFKVYQHVALAAEFSSLHLIPPMKLSSARCLYAWDHQELDASVCIELPYPLRAAPKPGQVGTHTEYVDIAAKLKVSTFSELRNVLFIHLYICNSYKRFIAKLVIYCVVFRSEL